VLDTTFKSTILLEAMRRTLVPWSEELEQRIQNVSLTYLDPHGLESNIARRNPRTA
jgi:hypothetical protein